MSVQIIDSNIIKKTQDSLGKIIKKPPMTEKLLSKPPFLFLHDIMTSVIKTTGFMNGLFSETEMNKDNIKDKEAKISFLQKVIDMISLVLGKTLSARPSKIISGNEPEKTNEMLQMLAEAINKKIDNDEYVQRILRPDDGIKKKKESSKHKKEKQDVNGMDDQKINASPEKKKHRSRNEVRHRDDEKHKSREKDKHEDDGAKKEDNRERRRHDKRGEETKERSNERREDRNGKSERHRSRKRDEDEDDNGKHEKKRQSKRTTEGDKMNKTVERTREQSGVKDADISNQEVAKSPVSVNRISKPERPSSARPAPPKPRKKEETQDEMLRLNQNVIIDKPHGSDDEDDFITKEIVDNQPGKDDNYVKRDHGILVKKILDTKKDLETHANYTKKTEIGHSEELVDASRTKDKQQMSKEIEKIRSMIQETTRNINPLGKTLDFLQESMDSMMKEINMWDEEAKHNKKLISEERSKTEATLEPLRAQFKDLEISIFEQLEKISALKNNILTNERKMNAMLNSVIMR